VLKLSPFLPLKYRVKYFIFFYIGKKMKILANAALAAFFIIGAAGCSDKDDTGDTSSEETEEDTGNEEGA
jgi:nitrogen regulatory protein PII-like uncharacterized protein